MNHRPALTLLDLTLALLGLTLALALPALAQQQIFPCDDMYSDPNHGGMPNTETELWCATFAGAGHYERIMLKFDQDELAAVGSTASSATLNIFRFFGCPSHPYTSTDIYAGTQDWDESTWPVTQHLPHETTAICPAVFGPGNGWYQIDVTDLVNSWLSGERANCGLVIEARTGEKWSKFYSKDHTSATFRPYLEVEGNGVGVPLSAAYQLTCAPNPFNPRTVISYNLPTAGHTTVRVFDARGRQIRLLADRHDPAGAHQLSWDGRDDGQRLQAAGSYLVVVDHAGRHETRRISLVK